MLTIELGAAPTVLDRQLLESACSRPQLVLVAGDAYVGLYAKAAALMQSLACNHAFEDGNKRAAFLGAMAFLAINGEPADRVFDEDTTYDLVLSVVKGEWSVGAMAVQLGVLVYDGRRG